MDDDESHTFPDLAPGTYLVSELVPYGSELIDIVCDGGNPDENGSTVSVTLAAGDAVECTFTNTYTPPPPTTGSINVTKDIIGAGTGTFTICVESDCKSFSAGDGEQQTWSDLAPGQYTVSEQDAGTTWTEPADQEVTVVAGQTAEVTVTNTYVPPPTTGSIQVTKDIIGSGTGTFTICVDSDCKSFVGDGAQQTWSDLAPGEYTVSEQDAGTTWTEPADQEVTVVAGQTAEVTVTNTYVPPPTTGSIQVTKDIIGSGTGTFTICVESDCKSFAGDGAQQTWSDLAPGEYTVSEQDAGTEWTEPADQQVTVVAGQTAEVTVTNTYDPPPPPSTTALFFSTTAVGTTGDGVAFGSEDILKWDGSAWSLWFDGSEALLTPKKAIHNINAFWIPDPNGEAFIFAFAQNRRHVPGLAAPVDGMDLLRWDGNAFSLYFDGSDVQLTNLGQEKIDALHILPGDAWTATSDTCLEYILISSRGPGKVTGYNGTQIKFGGEDVLGFCATSLGSTTAGKWHMVLDGSAEGMPRNSTSSISVSDDGQTIYLTTAGGFNVDTAAGGHSMVYAYDFDTDTFSGPFFSAPTAGLPAMVNGLHVAGDLP